MVTRAIALLIIVGDDETLGQDKNWRAYIDYIINNGGAKKNGKVMHPRI